MSRLSTYVVARLRKNDSSPQSAAADSDIGVDDDIFALLPPELEAALPPAGDDSSRRSISTVDLSRLSIDSDNWLYWDGKPVEVRRRVVMSRAQLAGASAIAAFLVIGACGAVLQGTIAARDWACRLGWSAGACATPAPPLHRADIPT